MNKESRLPKLMVYAGPRRYLTYASLALSAVSAAITVVPFYYIWLMLEEVLEVMPDYGLAVNIVHNGWMALGFTFLSVVLYVTALVCSHLSAFRIASNMKMTMIGHSMELPPGSFDTMGSGKARRIIQESSGSTETFLAHQLPDLAGMLVMPAAILVMLFVFDWRFGLAALLPIILALAIMMSTMNNSRMRDSMDRYQNALMNVNKDAVEYVRGISVVKTFQQTVHSFQNLKDSIDEYGKWTIQYTKWIRSRMVTYFTLVHSTFAFIILAAFAVSDGMSWTTETVLNFMFYIIFTPIVTVLLMRVMYAGQEMYRVDDALKNMDLLMSISPLEEPETPAEPDDYTVRFEDVSFTYPESDTPAVNGFSLTMRAGTTTALVGPSGSGKSTVGNLAGRLWDPQSGRISVGGRDLKEIGSANLGKITASVFQNNHIFKDTLANNVRIGRPDASDDEVLHALEQAQCGDILNKLPDGLETQLGPGGVYLSGGEVQRIAIARMILKDAPVIILDEATAFADPENEYLVQKAFENLIRDKTVLMIAHRLTTVRNADLICVMDKGSIREMGTHDELLARNGTYNRMWNDYQEALSWKVTGASQ